MQLIQFATEIKVRAERKYGELLAQDETKKGMTGNPNGQGARVVRSSDTTFYLCDLDQGGRGRP